MSDRDAWLGLFGKGKTDEALSLVSSMGSWLDLTREVEAGSKSPQDALTEIVAAIRPTEDGHLLEEGLHLSLMALYALDHAIRETEGWTWTAETRELSDEIAWHLALAQSNAICEATGIVGDAQIIFPDFQDVTALPVEGAVRLLSPGLPEVSITQGALCWIIDDQDAIRYVPAGCEQLIGKAIAERWDRAWRADGSWLSGRPRLRGRWSDAFYANIHGPFGSLFGDWLVQDRSAWEQTILKAFLRVAQPRFSQPVERIWKRLGEAERFRQPLRTLSPLDDPRFDADPYLREDVLVCDAACAAIRALLHLQQENDEHVLVRTLFERGWVHLFTPDGSKAPSTLTRSLGSNCLRWRNEDACLLDLGRIELPRARTGRLELMVALALATTHRRISASIRRRWLQADEETIRDLLGTFAEAHMFPVDLERGSLSDVMPAIISLFDYEGPAGCLRNYVERSAAWHREMQHPRGFAFSEDNYDDDTRLAPCPVALPREPRPGVTIDPLETVGTLRREGLQMGHCVACYAAAAVNGSTFLFHVEVGEFAATVELDDRLAIRQVQGPGNAANAACDWVNAHFPTLLRRGEKHV